MASSGPRLLEELLLGLGSFMENCVRSTDSIALISKQRHMENCTEYCQASRIPKQFGALDKLQALLVSDPHNRLDWQYVVEFNFLFEK
jgi:hypothetical protein